MDLKIIDDTNLTEMRKIGRNSNAAFKEPGEQQKR
jgi:hypothetical protein